VIEWADKAIEAFPQSCLRVTLDYEGENERVLRLKPQGDRYERLVLQVQDELNSRMSSKIK
jgi:tRNA A37 threonylcarbamoyladenosine biosynthesis protein TsaE